MVSMKKRVPSTLGHRAPNIDTRPTHAPNIDPRRAGALNIDHVSTVQQTSSLGPPTHQTSTQRPPTHQTSTLGLPCTKHRPKDWNVATKHAWKTSLKTLLEKHQKPLREKWRETLNEAVVKNAWKMVVKNAWKMREKIKGQNRDTFAHFGSNFFHACTLCLFSRMFHAFFTHDPRIFEAGFTQVSRMPKEGQKEFSRKVSRRPKACQIPRPGRQLGRESGRPIHNYCRSTAMPVPACPSMNKASVSDVWRR